MPLLLCFLVFAEDGSGGFAPDAASVPDPLDPATSSMGAKRSPRIMRLIGNRFARRLQPIYYVLHDMDEMPAHRLVLRKPCSKIPKLVGVQLEHWGMRMLGGAVQFNHFETFVEPDECPSNDRSLSSFANLRVWGFALIRAWVYLMFLGMGVGVLAQARETYAPTVYLWSSLALTVTLFSGVLAPERLELALLSLRGQVGAIALTVSGSVLVLLGGFAGAAVDVLAVAGGVATGVGSGLIHLGYGEIHRDHPPAEVGIEVPVAVLVAAVIFAAASALPFAGQALVASLLPVASGAIMISQQRSLTEEQVRAALKARRGLILPTPKLIMRIGLCACGIGLADGVARQVFMSATGVTPVSYYHPAMLTSSVILAVLLVGFELLRHDNTFRGLYKLITFIIAASIAFTPTLIGLPGYQWLGPVITLVGYNAFNAFVWILLADVTYNFRLSAAATFGMGWGMLTLGSTAGQMLGVQLGESGLLSPQVVSLVAAIGTLGVFAVCLFVMKDNDLVDIKDAQAMIESVGMGMGEEEEGSPHAQEVSACADAAPDAEAASNADAQPPKRAPFRERCTRFAREHELTPRETEILILFAKGRSAARIQEELVISRGTVTTHLQHIYRKADVHSKQELLDAIEGRKL